MIAGDNAAAGLSERGAAGTAVLAAVRAALGNPSRFALAFSGGLDSTVLLHALVEWAGRDAVVALHVKHGLQAAAAAWPEWCAQQAGRMGAAFEVIELTNRPAPGDSIEQWARQQRYPALCAAARRHNASALLTAHHADDQIETQFIRLGRGSGLEGLLGIDANTVRDGIRVCRPLLDLPREVLHRYASQHGLEWIDDPSNDDRRFIRNALRHTVLPAFDAAMPGFRQAVRRNSEHWREAVATLRELAQADLAPALPFGHRLPVLDRQPLVALTPARRAWALRGWLAALGLLAPDSARLAEMQRQLLLGDSAQARVDHQHVCLLRYRDRIVAVARATVDAAVGWSPLELRWTGQACFELAPGQGTLFFEPLTTPAPTETSIETPRGVPGVVVSADWLMRQDLRIVFGSLGALRQRLHPDRSSRPLKHLYQAHGVPAWLRALLPVCTIAGQVLYSGAFGADCDARWDGARPEPTPAQPHVRLRWQPPAELDEPLRACGYPWTAPV